MLEKLFNCIGFFFYFLQKVGCESLSVLDDGGGRGSIGMRPIEFIDDLEDEKTASKVANRIY